MTASVPQVSVVIPVYNEESILEAAIEGLIEGMRAKGRSFEILISENGSTDRTKEIAERLAEVHDEVRALCSDAPDYGAALKRGILAAQGEYVVCEEIDLCHIGFQDRALRILESGAADLVVGSKAAPGARDRRPPFRRVATRVINGLLRATLDFTGTDTHGLKAFRRQTLLPIVHQCVVTRDMFASEFVIRAERAGILFLEIPVDIEEKRPPSIRLTRRVPNVLKNLAVLIWEIRVKG
ncbi:MAG: glycosyltransferase family 2 protein [Deltaproteobacteria bacterium]|nr:MAG: glycosyltransferase family 2 protein [Deltaproteobacteria bacterium]